jgi:hypothetical protein
VVTESVKRLGSVVVVTAATALILGIVLFVVAIAVVTVLHPRGHFCVDVVNRSSIAIEDLELKGGGADAALDSLQPSARLRHCFETGPEGALVLRFRFDNRAVEYIVDGYITSGEGGEAVAEILDDGSVSVEVVRREMGLDPR